MFSISSLFPSMHWRCCHLSRDQPPVTVDTFQRGLEVRRLTGPASSLTLKSAGSPWFSHLYNGSVSICFSLASWKQQYLLFFWLTGRRKGERDVEHVRGAQIISLTIHGNLCVGYHCFHVRNGGQAWLSGWPSHVVLKPEGIWTQVIWLRYTVEFYVESWEKWQVWFYFLSFCSGTYENHFPKPL